MQKIKWAYSLYFDTFRCNPVWQLIHPGTTGRKWRWPMPLPPVPKNDGNGIAVIESPLPAPPAMVVSVLRCWQIRLVYREQLNLGHTTR
jgi:hypothetical protein